MSAEAIEQRLQLAEVREVADADRAAADLVLIGGADAAPRRPDLARAAGILAQRIEVAVDGEDERAGLREHQDLRRDLHALFLDSLDLGLQRPRIEHDAVADDRRRAGDDPRREQRQFVGLAADDERVARIVAALEAHDHVGPAGEPVDDLAFALVAPLRADDRNVAQVESPM